MIWQQKKVIPAKQKDEKEPLPTVQEELLQELSSAPEDTMTQVYSGMLKRGSSNVDGNLLPVANPLFEATLLLLTVVVQAVVVRLYSALFQELGVELATEQVQCLRSYLLSCLQEPATC